MMSSECTRVMFFGLLTAVLGLIATLLGGIAGDALRRRFSGSYFLVSGAAMCIAFPMLLLMVELPFPIAWVAMGGFVFCLFFNTGPTNTILANVVHPQLRARGFALNILIIHLLGDAISPFVMGRIIGNQNRYALAFQSSPSQCFLADCCGSGARATSSATPNWRPPGCPIETRLATQGVALG